MNSNLVQNPAHHNYKLQSRVHRRHNVRSPAVAPNTCDKMSAIDCLTDDALMHVLRFVPTRNAVRCTCRRFRRIVSAMRSVADDFEHYIDSRGELAAWALSSGGASVTHTHVEHLVDARLFDVARSAIRAYPIRAAWPLPLDMGGHVEFQERVVRDLHLWPETTFGYDDTQKLRSDYRGTSLAWVVRHNHVSTLRWLVPILDRHGALYVLGMKRAFSKGFKYGALDALQALYGLMNMRDANEDALDRLFSQKFLKNVASSERSARWFCERFDAAPIFDVVRLSDRDAAMRGYRECTRLEWCCAARAASVKGLHVIFEHLACRGLHVSRRVIYMTITKVIRFGTLDILRHLFSKLLPRWPLLDQPFGKPYDTHFIVAMSLQRFDYILSADTEKCEEMARWIVENVPFGRVDPTHVHPSNPNGWPSIRVACAMAAKVIQRATDRLMLEFVRRGGIDANMMRFDEHTLLKAVCARPTCLPLVKHAVENLALKKEDFGAGQHSALDYLAGD